MAEETKKRKRSKLDEPEFCLHKGEAIPAGLARTLNEQLEAASSFLRNGSAMEEAIHNARKALKKCRSILRILRPVLGPVYRTANAQLRDEGRKLSELRDAQALIETIDGFGSQGTRLTVLKRIKQVHFNLQKRKNELSRKLSDAGDIAELAAKLEEVRNQIAAWPIADADQQTIFAAVKETVKRGRRAFKQALADEHAENYHEWRKRVKDLRYQLEFVSQWWPDVLEGYAKNAKNLEQELGEDHNLAVLYEMAFPAKSAAANSSEDLKTLLINKQIQLRANAQAIGRVLYGEKPKHWARRLELCYKLQDKDHAASV